MENTLKKTQTRKGFTLVELLIVIAIIGLLAALLFPILARVQANARRVTCVSNLRQLGMAIAMYAQDADEVFVPSLQKGGKTVSWSQALQPHLKDKKVLECPDDDTKSVESYGLSSYGYNAHLGGVAFPQFESPKLDHTQKSLVQVVRPASTVLMTDSGTIPLAGNGAPESWPSMTPCPQEIGDTSVMSSHQQEGAVQNGALAAPRARHSGKTNVLWVDGHVTTAAIASFYVSPGVKAPGETVPGYAPCLRPEKGCPQ